MSHPTTKSKLVTFDLENPPPAGIYRALLDNNHWCDAVARYKNNQFAGWEIACSNMNPDASIVGYEPN